MIEFNLQNIGKLAYETHAEHSDNKDAVKWDKLPRVQQLIWMATAKEILTHVSRVISKI